MERGEYSDSFYDQSRSGKAGALLIDTPKEGEVLYPSILLRGTKEK